MATFMRMSRRAVLGSAGALVALPFLESLVPRQARAAAGEECRRVMWVHMHNGMSRRLMTPPDSGANYTLTPWLAPFAEENLRDEITVLTGLQNDVGDPQGEVAVHPADSASFLTGVVPGSGTNPTAGISIDQIAANELGVHTPLAPSLVIDTNTKECGDGKHGCVYYSNISWTDDTTPAPRENNPTAIFERIFGGWDPDATDVEVERRKVYKRSVLDNVMGDVERVRTKVSASDEQQLDEYLESVRALENSIEAGVTCDPGNAPPSFSDFEQQVEQMYDLVALAFACDATRVVAMSLNHHVGGQFDFVDPPATSGHHSLSHGTTAAEREQYEAITKWEIESFAMLTKKLRDATDGEGNSVLDNSIVLFGAGHDSTGHENGDETLEFAGVGIHRTTDLPLFLAGSGGGHVTPGRHLVYNGEPLADLYIAMLASAGIDLASFGRDGTQALTGLA